MNHTINFNTYCGCKDKFFPNYSLVLYLRYLVPFLRFKYFFGQDLVFYTLITRKLREFLTNDTGNEPARETGHTKPMTRRNQARESG